MIIKCETKPIKSTLNEDYRKDILINHLDYRDIFTKIYVHKGHNNQKYNNIDNSNEELNFEILI